MYSNIKTQKVRTEERINTIMTIMEGFPQSPRGQLEQQWAQMAAEREARNAAEAAAAEEQRQKDEQARLEHEAREARRNSDEVRVLNDNAVVEMFGSQGQTLYGHETGEVIATPDKPIMGKYERIVADAEATAKTRPAPQRSEIIAEAKAKAEAYKQNIQEMIDNGFEPAQANLVDQISTERQKTDRKRIEAFYKRNLKTMDSAKALTEAFNQVRFMNDHNGESEGWVRDIIQRKGIYTREEYDAYRKSEEFKNRLNNAKGDMRFYRHNRSRTEVRDDYAEKQAHRDEAKAEREKAAREAAEAAEKKRLEDEAKQKAEEEARRKAEEEAAERARAAAEAAAAKPRTETPRTHHNYSSNAVVRWFRGVPGSRLKDKVGYMAATLSSDVREKRAGAREFAETDATVAEKAQRFAEAGMVAASLAMLHGVENAQEHLDNLSEQAKAEIAKREGRRARNRRKAHENKDKDGFEGLDSLFSKEEGEKRGYERGNDSVSAEDSRKQVEQIRRMSVEDLTKGLSDEDVAKLSTPALNAYKMRRTQLPKLQRIQQEQAKAKAKGESQPINLGELLRADEPTQRATIIGMNMEQIMRLSPDDVQKLAPVNRIFVSALQRARREADQIADNQNK